MKCGQTSSESARGLHLIGCLLDDRLPCAHSHRAWAETAVSEAGDGHPKLYPLRMETKAASKSLRLIKDLVFNNSGIFRSHQSPGADSIRLGRRWGPRILGNLGFFFSSPSFSVLMLFYNVKHEKCQVDKRCHGREVWLSRTFILGRKLIRTRLDSRLRGSLTLTPRCFMYV